MPTNRVSILNAEKLEIAILDYVEHPPSMRLTLESGWTTSTSGLDIYECLGKIIKELPDIKFLCKGAKINVRPSSMSSQMSSGIVAYEHKLGVKPSRKSIVNIFDYEDQDIINDPQMQTDYFFRWLESIK
ncbi:hypothetical protein IMF27_15120 [Pseudomonas sp. PCH199]|uniref:hypothetical protein n=1 Tax=unclassified Pseudomonas TaxID=196821 RepID=UPI000BC39305|nr:MULTISPECIES: hypothetical protein [unclassified Pseudomonas]MCW8276840.1 hypothetical protein [Pseudomonas sp. PCH199]PAM83119.1 hypothetical protein CES87_15425 [Pseudomonas sp. ERMR1:02]